MHWLACLGSGSGGGGGYRINVNPGGGDAAVGGGDAVPPPPPASIIAANVAPPMVTPRTTDPITTALVVVMPFVPPSHPDVGLGGCSRTGLTLEKVMSLALNCFIAFLFGEGNQNKKMMVTDQNEWDVLTTRAVGFAVGFAADSVRLDYRPSGRDSKI